MITENCKLRGTAKRISVGVAFVEAIVLLFNKLFTSAQPLGRVFLLSVKIWLTPTRILLWYRDISYGTIGVSVMLALMSRTSPYSETNVAYSEEF